MHSITDSTTHSVPRHTDPETAGIPSAEETLAYLELTPRQTFGLAYALLAHCRRFGQPRTALQHEMAGLRDFLLDLLDEHQVDTLLESL
jgi:hypothetical protein